MILTGVFNWLRYEKNFDEETIKARWVNVKNNYLYGWIISISLATLLLIPPIYGYVTHNLK